MDKEKIRQDISAGTTRLRRATGYSLRGLRAAFKHEQAFRLEVYILPPIVLLGLGLGNNGTEKVLLIGSWLIVLITELMNSAVEAVVDRIGSEQHELSGRAKDIASAAVMVALALTATTWTILIF
jgi:diacylglycerol kinase (ATP)